MTATQNDGIEAALAVAEDLASGSLSAAELDEVAVAECRALFVTVAGPDDPLFELQVAVCRAVLAAGGIGADELAEWLAVAKRCICHDDAEPPPPDDDRGPQVLAW